MNTEESPPHALKTCPQFSDPPPPDSRVVTGHPGDDLGDQIASLSPTQARLLREYLQQTFGLGSSTQF